jgi:hypothetical protein
LLLSDLLFSLSRYTILYAFLSILHVFNCTTTSPSTPAIIIKSNLQQMEMERRKHEITIIELKADKERNSMETELSQLRCLIGNVAHDLKTPLQSIAMDLEVLKSDCGLASLSVSVSAPVTTTTAIATTAANAASAAADMLNRATARENSDSLVNDNNKPKIEADTTVAAEGMRDKDSTPTALIATSTTSTSTSTSTTTESIQPVPEKGVSTVANEPNKNEPENKTENKAVNKAVNEGAESVFESADATTTTVVDSHDVDITVAHSLSASSLETAAAPAAAAAAAAAVTASSSSAAATTTATFPTSVIPHSKVTPPSLPLPLLPLPSSTSTTRAPTAGASAPGSVTPTSLPSRHTSICSVMTTDSNGSSAITAAGEPHLDPFEIIDSLSATCNFMSMAINRCLDFTKVKGDV